MSIVRFLAVVESLIELDITPSFLSISKKLVEDRGICQIVVDARVIWAERHN